MLGTDEGKGKGVALAGKVELPVLELLVAHDVLPNYYNYVGKTKILINDNFFVVSASQLIKSITHNATGGRRRRELQRERGDRVEMLPRKFCYQSL